MEKYTIQIEMALDMPQAHISITAPLFSREVPSEQEINDFLHRILSENTFDKIAYKTAVIRL